MVLKFRECLEKLLKQKYFLWLVVYKGKSYDFEFRGFIKSSLKYMWKWRGCHERTL